MLKKINLGNTLCKVLKACFLKINYFSVFIEKRRKIE